MATTFSGNFNTDSNGAFIPGLVDASASHARLRKKRMFASPSSAAATDYLVMGTFKSSDRLYDLRLSTDSATPTTGAFNLGLWKAGLDHDPDGESVVIDADLFASAIVVTTELDRSDVFVESGTLEDHQRGLRLWELADAGAGSYSEDPMEDWDLVIDWSTALDAAQGILIEADFVSFG